MTLLLFLVQDRWINEFLNQAYDSVYTSDTDPANLPTNTLDSQSLLVLDGAKVCLDEFYATCEECALEISFRDPKVIAHCRSYINRYAELWTSRLILELSPYYGTSVSPGSIPRSPASMLKAISFISTLDTLKRFAFIQRQHFATLKDSLMSPGLLSKMFVQRLMDETNTWFDGIHNLQPRQRGNKLAEYHQLLNHHITMVLAHYRVASPQQVRDKFSCVQNVVDSLVIHLSRKVEVIAFGDYGEDAFLGHIIACQECVKYFINLRVSSSLVLSSSPRPPPQGPIEGEATSPPPSSSTESYVDIGISLSVLDSVCSIFLLSAENAAATVVRNVAHSFEDILRLFLDERRGSAWLGDKVCRAYVDRVQSWFTAFRNGRGMLLHSEFRFTTNREVVRVLFTLYMQRLIGAYRNNNNNHKKLKLSDEGVMQVASDLRLISEAVLVLGQDLDLHHTDQDPPPDRAGTGDQPPPPPPHPTPKISQTADITALIKTFRLFLMSDTENLLLCFAEAMQQFGYLVSPHLYDLIRFSLKIRKDISESARHRVLALSAEFINQMSSNPLEALSPIFLMNPRLSGPDILSELMPHAGSMHCTGKKFSYEKLSDSDSAARLEVANIVTESCTISRLRRSSSLAVTYSTNSRSSISSKWHRMYPADVKYSYHDYYGQPVAKLVAQTKEADLAKAHSGEKSSHRYNNVGSGRRDSVESLGEGIAGSGPGSGTSTGTPFASGSFEDSLVDLDSCSFQELHFKLCPEVFRDRSFAYDIVRLVYPPDSDEDEDEDLFIFTKDEEQQGRCATVTPPLDLDLDLHLAYSDEMSSAATATAVETKCDSLDENVNNLSISVSSKEAPISNIEAENGGSIHFATLRCEPLSGVGGSGLQNADGETRSGPVKPPKPVKRLSIDRGTGDAGGATESSISNIMVASTSVALSVGSVGGDGVLEEHVLGSDFLSKAVSQETAAGIGREEAGHLDNDNDEVKRKTLQETANGLGEEKSVSLQDGGGNSLRPLKPPKPERLKDHPE